MLKPIETEQDYEEALERVHQLGKAEVGTDDSRELKVLLALIELYENKHHPIDVPDPVGHLRFVLDQKKVSPSELLDVFGTASRLSEVLSGQRALSVNQARKLCLRFSLTLESMAKYFV